MKVKRALALLLALTMCAALLGCAAKVETETPEGGAVCFTDDEGNVISLDKPAERIISMYSAHTENLYSLGAEGRLIGGHTTCVYPAEAAQTAIFDYKGDPEYIIAAEPDVVLIRPHISRSSPEEMAALKNAGICIVSLYPETMEDFPEYINKLAMLTGTEARAAELLADFDADLAAVHEMTSTVADRQTVFFESTEENIRTVAEGSLPALAIELAGGINIADGAQPMTEGSSIAEFGAERVLENGDAIDVYVSQRGAMNAGGDLQSIAERPGFDTVRAVRDGRVYVINEKLISSPTFRFYKGVRELARYMYPELMDDASSLASDDAATRRVFAGLIVRCLHKPIYVPGSSKYYQSQQKGHTYGRFADISWRDEDFDYIETAVYSGLLSYREADAAEYFDPEGTVSREELAKAVFIAGDFAAGDAQRSIKDISQCENARIVQALVDNGVFELSADGCFEPERAVSCNEIIAALGFIQ